jgi:uncharacterized protein (DUF1501 family)
MENHLNLTNISRRSLLQTSAAAAVSYTLLGTSGLSLAATGGQKRLVIILLRGGMDGLALAAPYGDPDYRQARGILALPSPKSEDGLIDLDGFWGLHPSASALFPLWAAKELSLIPAMATDYRGRSHFDAQAILETGYKKTTKNGWLNRAIGLIGAKYNGTATTAIAVNTALPLILQGPNPSSNWYPSHMPRAVQGFYEKVSLMYKDDPILSTALIQGLRTRENLERSLSDDDRKAAKQARKVTDLSALASLTGHYLAEPDGARIAVLEASGWDSHQNQGTLSGKLARNITGLSNGILALKDALGPAWTQTVVIIQSEFGRTVAPNGTKGTDHGTAGLGLLAGGAVRGGQIIGDWTGLAHDQLYEGRDLKPNIDSRMVLKGILKDHYKLKTTDLDNKIFPNSSKYVALKGLIK